MEANEAAALAAISSGNPTKMTRTAKLVNLGIAGIAKRATETVLRTARAMLGPTGWRVTRRVVEEHERDAEEAAAGVLDELAAMCTLLSLMAPPRPGADPRRDFLMAEPVRLRARLLVTFEHIEATKEFPDVSQQLAAGRQRRNISRRAPGGQRVHGINISEPG